MSQSNWLLAAGVFGALAYTTITLVIMVLFMYFANKRTELLKEMVDLLAKEAAGRVAPGTAYDEIVSEERE